jgi:hypothetical protein
MNKLLLLLCLLFPVLVFAQERWIDMEWEAVPGAKEYELELYQDVAGSETPRGKYKVDSAVWSHSVAPGKYSIRIRSLDSRGVPGEWSELTPLKVRLRNPQLLRPVPDDVVTDTQVNLEWAEIDGAAQYQVIVRGPSDKVVLNSVVAALKTDVYLDSMGSYRWSVFALEKDEGTKDRGEWVESNFRSFTRAGGELEAPTVVATVDQRMTISWAKIRNAQNYEVDHFPPPGPGAKNRRYRLKQSPLALKKEALPEGVTTFTVKSVGSGYQDSRKSVVKIARSGSKVEVEDIVQGKPEEAIVIDPSVARWKSQYFLTLVTGNYAYDSKNIENDTILQQKKLTTLGVAADFHWQPRLNSLLHKFSFSTVNFSNGVESGKQMYASYLLNAGGKFLGGRVHYGGGASYLQVPAFMGDRFLDKINVENTSGLGPEINVAWLRPVGASCLLDTRLNYLYLAHILSSDREDEEAFGVLRGQLLVHKYFTKKEAFTLGLDYQSWQQKWGSDTSEVSGVSVVLGFKGSF